MRTGKNKNLKALIITLIILLLMGVLPQNNYGVLSNGVSLIPLGFFRLTASARSTPGSAETPDEVKSLEAENAELRQKLVNFEDLERENERLREFFKISSRHTDYTLKPAEVIAKNPDDDFYSFTLSVGASDGVQKGDPVITQNGLVGIVEYADNYTCAVKTVLSPGFIAAAMDKQTLDSGTVSGRAELCEKNQTSIIMLSEISAVKSGDIVTTSGKGGVFPENLIIGRVVSCKDDAFDSSRYAVLELFESIKNIESAAVVTDFSGKGELKIE